MRLPSAVPSPNVRLIGKNGVEASGWPVGALYYDYSIGRNSLLLVEPWWIRWRLSDGRRAQLTLDAGYECDGASIPRALWSFVGGPFEGLYLLAALPHDGLYDRQPISRAESDRAFSVIIDAFGGPAPGVYWAGVRAGGWLAWKQNKTADFGRFVHFEVEAKK